MENTLLDKIADRLEGIERARSCHNENYLAGRQQRVYVPREAAPEFRALANKATVNYIGLVVRSLLQDLKITAYRHANSDETAKDVWAAWVKQGMIGKSLIAIRHAAVHGHSYLALVPRQNAGGRIDYTAAVFTPHEVVVEYDDAINDPRPAVFACRMPGRPDVAVVWIDKTCFTMDIKTKMILGQAATSAQFFGDTEPVVRFTAGDWIVDPRGQWATTGEIELLFAAQDRLTQAVMDLLLVQTFGAVAVRWIAGLELKADQADAVQQKIELAADRFLTAEDPETRFGNIVGTPLEPFIRNVAAAREDFVMLAQASPTRFMSKIENVGNDAILTAREPYEAKLGAYRENHGLGFEMFARAVAVAAGQEDPGTDGYFTWRSTELRTLAELIDAVVKADSVGLNAEPLIRRNLTWGTEEQDEFLEGYQRRRQEGDPATRELVATLGRQGRPAGPAEQPVALPAGASQTGAGNPAAT